MKKAYWYILGVIVFGLVIGTAVYQYTFRKAEISMATQKADLEIKASELILKYNDNEASSDSAYRDKVIVVSGLIDKISEDSASVSLYIKNSEDIAGVMCGFDKTAIDKANFKVGDQIKVKGKCIGLNFDVYMNKCSIEK